MDEQWHSWHRNHPQQPPSPSPAPAKGNPCSFITGSSLRARTSLRVRDNSAEKKKTLMCLSISALVSWSTPLLPLQELGWQLLPSPRPRGGGGINLSRQLGRGKRPLSSSATGHGHSLGTEASPALQQGKSGAHFTWTGAPKSSPHTFPPVSGKEEGSWVDQPRADTAEGIWVISPVQPLLWLPVVEEAVQVSWVVV